MTRSPVIRRQPEVPHLKVSRLMKTTRTRITGFLGLTMSVMWGAASVLCAGPLPSGVLDEVVKQEPSPLAPLVRQYVTAEASKDIQGMETSILAHPEATLSNLIAHVKRSRVYDREPVGLQPGRSLVVDGTVSHYGLFVPPSYDPSKSYPLVVCLHGYGFSGDDYLSRWTERLGEKYLLACPTYMSSAWWTRFGEELVLATIKDVRNRYHVDVDRIFLTGMSNGGIGTWIIGMHHADVFAGIAPMASGIDEVLYPFVANLRHTPVYVIHGAKDDVMPVRLSRELVQEMVDRHIPHVYREHPYIHPHAGGHFFPRQELPALVKWFDVQRRSPLPREVAVVRDASHLLSFSWIRIDATDRIAAFSNNLVDSSDPFIRQKIYATLHAKVVAVNHIKVQTQFVRRFSLFLNDEFIDFSKPLVVETNGTRSWTGIIQPSRHTLLHQARLRQDSSRVFPVRLPIQVMP